MGRNDKCFCGSGKKHKYCHSNINERSLAADTIKLYNNIDEKIYGLKNRICKEGCSECCSQFFAISEIEFALIIDYFVNNFGIDKTKQIINNGIIHNLYIIYSIIHDQALLITYIITIINKGINVRKNSVIAYI